MRIPPLSRSWCSFAGDLARSFCVLIIVAAFVCPAISGQQLNSQLPSDLEPIQALIQKGQLGEAKIRVTALLNQQPSSVAAYNLLGIVETNQQEYSNALSAFHKALQLAPSSVPTLNNLGNLYLAQKNLDQAEKEFKTVLRLDPNNQDGHYSLGLLLLARGAPVEAILHFESMRPATTAGRLNLIRAYLQAHRNADAVRSAAELSAKNKDNVQLHLSLGMLLASKKLYKPARLEFEKADVLQPGTFEIIYNLGQAALLDGNDSQAELELSRALKLKPDSPDALYKLAEVYTSESRPMDALDLLVRAHKTAPDNLDIIMLIAKISIAQKYFEDAIPLLEQGLRIAPQRSDLRLELGECYFKSDKVDKAIDQFTQVIDTEPSARAYAFLGLSYLFLGRFDEAKRNFEKGLEADPHNSFCLFQLGYVAELRGDKANANVIFRKVLQVDPDFPTALLGLANLLINDKKFAEAEILLKRLIRVSPNSATGYYKLAMVERGLNRPTEAQRYLAQFQNLSRDDSNRSHIYENLFDYFDSRSKLPVPAREQQDVADLVEQNSKHPDQPEVLYMLAAAYFKAGEVPEAKNTITQYDRLNVGNDRALTGSGVLLARYHLYGEAIQQFEMALQANEDSDDIKFDLSDAYFRSGHYAEALDAANKVSERGRQDDAYLTLLGDIYAHLGNGSRAEEIFRRAISRNPDNDQDYLSLSLLELRAGHIADAKETLLQGQTRLPASGKILWGLGLTLAMEGNTTDAARHFEQAVEMLPEWPGSYSTLGVFYFQTGQISKAKEVLDRFKNSNTGGGLDVNKIEQVLSQAPANPAAAGQPMAIADRQRLLQLALTLADKTL
jgi:tetratricopeptide (TPR) repeat protein